MTRQVSAFIVSPIIIGVIMPLFTVAMRGDLENLKGTFILVPAFVLGYSLLLVLPPYILLRIMKRYSLSAILKVGGIAGTLTGVSLTWFFGAWFAFVGLVYGVLGGYLFHLVHGNVAITKL